MRSYGHFPPPIIFLPSLRPRPELLSPRCLNTVLPPPPSMGKRQRNVSLSGHSLSDSDLDSDSPCAHTDVRQTPTTAATLGDSRRTESIPGSDLASPQTSPGTMKFVHPVTLSGALTRVSTRLVHAPFSVSSDDAVSFRKISIFWP